MLQAIDEESIQPQLGSRPHWEFFERLQDVPELADPLRKQVVRLVDAAISANPLAPFISSRVAGVEALESLGTDWQESLRRRFTNSPPDVVRGLFGMALWHYLADPNMPLWHFAKAVEPQGDREEWTNYFRNARAEGTA
jgi:hypothetical protein